FDAILTAMYVMSTSGEGAEYLCVPPDPGIRTSASATPGTRVSATPGAGEAAALARRSSLLLVFPDECSLVDAPHGFLPRHLAPSLPSQDVTFDESVPYYRLFPYRTAPLPPPPPLFLAPGAAVVDPLPPEGAAPSGVSQVDPVEPVEVAVDSRPAAGAEPGVRCLGVRSLGVLSRGLEVLSLGVLHLKEPSPPSSKVSDATGAAGAEDPGVGATACAADLGAGAAAGAEDPGVGAPACAADLGVGAAAGAEDPGVELLLVLRTLAVVLLLVL
ncbi:unnamed protein product, partial [Closterium sp. NIES-64]